MLIKEDMVGGAGEGIHGNSGFSAQYFCEPKTALKTSLFIKTIKNKNGTGHLWMPKHMGL